MEKELVFHIAQIAHLHLTESEADKFLKEFKEILKIFEKLEKADAEPSFHPIDIRNSFRPDKPKPCLTQEKALSLTKNKKGESFLGPKTL